jgi:energy-coupling factor transporter transmembrane protein EcfT
MKKETLFWLIVHIFMVFLTKGWWALCVIIWAIVTRDKKFK